MKKYIVGFAFLSFVFYPSFLSSETPIPAKDAKMEVFLIDAKTNQTVATQVISLGGVPAPLGIEIPAPLAHQSDFVVKHYAYTVSYNKDTKIANWVAYELTKAETQAVVERKDKFIPDPLIPDYPLQTSDYTYSGYDRGHIAPAADMLFNETAMVESFYLSNIFPQDPSGNRGVWSRLEDLVRKWAVADSVVWLCSAPIIKKSTTTISDKKIAVPDYVCKAIIAKDGPDKYKGIAFLLENRNYPSINLQDLVITIDSLENFSGLNFFYTLDKNKQDEAESHVDKTKWTW